MISNSAGSVSAVTSLFLLRSGCCRSRADALADFVCEGSRREPAKYGPMTPADEVLGLGFRHGRQREARRSGDARQKRAYASSSADGMGVLA
jgi:hypothetical protein